MEPAQMPTLSSPALTDGVRAFLRQPLFASLATADATGAPRQAVIWYRLEDDDRILVNSRIGRFWPANVQRDGRVSLAVIGADGYQWVGLTGHVAEIVDDPAPALADIEALAWRYHPDGPDSESLASFRAYPRISFHIAIDRVHDHLED
jgi:PPOX class probable F420-dependent enzyme